MREGGSDVAYAMRTYAGIPLEGMAEQMMVPGRRSFRTSDEAEGSFG